MQINKIHANDYFDDNNCGYTYGIEWDINNDIDNAEWHCQWFILEKVRDKAFKKMQFMENTLIGQYIISVTYFFKYKLFQK